MATLRNLVPNGSFERTGEWSGITYGTEHALFGVRSQKFPSGGTYIATCPMPLPVVNHVYYGRHYLRSEGNNAPADCRFEWFAGDGPGLNFVFGWNRGNWPAWGMESSVVKVTAVKASSFVCRSFVVNSTAPMWTDGLMILDLTAAFGAGKEPDKAWCDAYLPFFEDSLEVTAVEREEVAAVTLTPNPVQQSASLKVSVTMESGTAWAVPYWYLSGDVFAGEG